jgi:hypothetical protein
MYVCFVLNNAFSEVIQSTPLRQAYGTDNDISPMLYFLFYEPVYYLVDETTFPSKSKELRGRWVGVSKNVGHFMTYKILTDDTRRLFTVPTFVRWLILMHETYVLTRLMTNHLRLSGLYARLLLLRIMGRISHFTLWNLLMKVLNVLPLEMTRLLSTHKNCWVHLPYGHSGGWPEVPCPHCRMHF